MFTLSRADAGQYPVAPHELYLDELASECVQSFRSLAAAKSISLSMNSGHELSIVADESLIRRMLLNLIDNAIKYTPTGGTVSIATDSTDERAEISVANDGPGIPVELQPRIFERFFRGDQARTRSTPDGGAGLGLSIAKWIAEVHHGSLELTRSDLTGTVFTVNLPRASSTSAQTD